MLEIWGGMVPGPSLAKPTQWNL